MPSYEAPEVIYEIPKTKIYLVVVQDTVIQGTGYIVRATDVDAAKASVAEGMYIEETKTETLDTIDSKVVEVTEIAEMNAPGQAKT